MSDRNPQSGKGMEVALACLMSKDHVKIHCNLGRMEDKNRPRRRWILMNTTFLDTVLCAEK